MDLGCRSEDEVDEVIVRTKLVRGNDSAAVCVSEAVSHAVLDVLGLEVADPYAVRVSEEFADELREQYGFDEVYSGPHWGTRLMVPEASPVEFDPDLVEDLREPEQLFTLYLGDVILGHPDRDTMGNVLVRSSGSGGMDLIPIDQSDCFNHPRALRDPEFLDECRDHTLADNLDGMASALLDAGEEFLEDEFRRVRRLRTEIVECFNEGRDEWYDRSGVSRDALRRFLDYRMENLEDLAQMDHWRNLYEEVEGGRVLRF